AGLGEELLAVRRGGVGQEGLDGAEGVGLVAGVADDLVRDQDQRVGAVGLGGVVEVERQVLAGALDLGGGDGLGGVLGGRLDRGGAAGVDVDRGDLLR